MSTTVELDKAKQEIAALKRDLEVSEQQLTAACQKYEMLRERVFHLARLADERPMGTAYHTEITDLLDRP